MGAQKGGHASSWLSSHKNANVSVGLCLCCFQALVLNCGIALQSGAVVQSNVGVQTGGGS